MPYKVAHKRSKNKAFQIQDIIKHRNSIYHCIFTSCLFYMISNKEYSMKPNQNKKYDHFSKAFISQNT